MLPKNIYFLDRNIVISILTKIEKNQNVGKGFKIAEKIDCKENSINLMLSFIEGEKARQLNGLELYDQIKRETALLKGFFVNAKVDSYVESYNGFIVAWGMISELYEKAQKYSPFILEMQNLLKQQITSDLRNKKFKEILNIALAHNLNKSNIYLVVAIACLFNNPYARGVFFHGSSNKNRTKEQIAYNTFCDLHQIYLYSMFSAYPSAIGINSYLLTTDKNLKKLTKQLKPRPASIKYGSFFGADDLYNFEFSCPGDFFPDASKSAEEINNIIESFFKKDYAQQKELHVKNRSEFL